MSIDLSRFEQALRTLEDALVPPPANDRERDGAIQRFEYCFEIAWKLGKRVLQLYGVESNSPKTVIRDCGEQGWIPDARLWMSFLDARNDTSHIYKKEVAERVFEMTKAFLPAAQSFLSKLRQVANKP